MTPTTQNTISARFHEYRADLKQLTEGLIESMKPEKKDYKSKNRLLRDYYGLTGKALKTFDQWKESNYSINKGEHAYRFWGAPVPTKENFTYCPVVFLFCEDQVRPSSYQASA